jgi:hypothetical protein
MDKIKSFESFINEAQMKLSNPDTAGDTLSGVLAANLNAKESPKGSNTSPEVNAYLKSVGLGPGLPWCAAFVYYIFDQVSKKLSITNPLPKTGGVRNHWAAAPADVKITAAQIRANPKLLKPGQIFMQGRGAKALGHTGIIAEVNPEKGTFVTIEGNSSDKVSINTRRIGDTSFFGYLDYFKTSRTPDFEADVAKAVTGKAIPLSPINGAPSDNEIGGGPLATATASSGDNEVDKGFVSSLFGGIAASLRGGGGKGIRELSVGDVKAAINALR